MIQIANLVKEYDRGVIAYRKRQPCSPPETMTEHEYGLLAVYDYGWDKGYDSGYDSGLSNGYENGRRS